MLLDCLSCTGHQARSNTGGSPIWATTSIRGDILAANDSRVFPARLYGRKPTGGRVELLLLEQLGQTGAGRPWPVVSGLSKGHVIHLDDAAGAPSQWAARVTAVLDGPLREIQFDEADGWPVEYAGPYTSAALYP